MPGISTTSEKKMPKTIVRKSVPTADEGQAESTRPLYVRRVPESIWNLVHINAIKSRMRLQTYLVQIMERSEPLLPGDEDDVGAVANPTADSNRS